MCQIAHNLEYGTPHTPRQRVIPSAAPPSVIPLRPLIPHLDALCPLVALRSWVSARSVSRRRKPVLILALMVLEHKYPLQNPFVLRGHSIPLNEMLTTDNTGLPFGPFSPASNPRYPPTSELRVCSPIPCELYSQILAENGVVPPSAPELPEITLEGDGSLVKLRYGSPLPFSLLTCNSLNDTARCGATAVDTRSGEDLSSAIRCARRLALSRPPPHTDALAARGRFWRHLAVCT